MHNVLTLLLGILFQLTVFILVLGTGVSCCGSKGPAGSGLSGAGGAFVISRWGGGGGTSRGGGGGGGALLGGQGGAGGGHGGRGGQGGGGGDRARA